MTAYVSVLPGAPTSGNFVVGDTVTDNNGTVWQCTVGGFDARWVAAPTGLSPTETAVLDGVTPGTVLANKAVVTGDDKHIDTLVFTEGGLKIGAGAGTAVGSTAAELNVTDGATAANNTTGKAAILGADGAITFAGAVTEQVVGLTSAGVGAVNGGTVTVVEAGSGGIHKTVLTLSGTPITLTDDPGQGAYVGLKLYDFPAGNIVTLGAAINADVTLTAAETWWVDDKAGDVGLGTVATAVGTALTGTTQNIIASTATTSAAQVSSIDTQSTGVGTSGAAGGTDADIVLNFRVDDDALHFPDLAVNGTFGADTNWTKGTGWTIGAGVASCDGSQEDVSDLTAATNALIFNGVSYSVTYTVTRSAGTVTPVLGTTLGVARSSANTFTETIIAGAGGVLLFRADADFVGTLDDVILTPLTGTGAITGTVTVVWVNAGDF